MSQQGFISWSGATGALTAPISGVGLTTTAKTIQQILAPAAAGMSIKEWGYVYLGSTLPTVPIQLELLTTGTVAATLPNSGVIHNFTTPTGAGSLCQISTTGTAWGIATSEGTITASRLLAMRAYPADWSEQWPLSDEPGVPAAGILRIRGMCGSGTATIATYVRWVEGA